MERVGWEKREEGEGEEGWMRGAVRRGEGREGCVRGPT